MFIRRLSVDNFGGIAHFEKSLSSQPAVVITNDPKALISVVSLLLESKCPYPAPPAPLAGQDKRLYAEIETNNGVFNVEKLYDRNDTLTTKITHRDRSGNVYADYQTFMHRSPEEDDICFFNASKKQLAPNRLFRYSNEEKFYSPGELGSLTGGMGTTKTFRACLKNYIYKESLLPEINLDPFVTKEKVPFWEFLDTAQFWDKFCKIRDLHYEGKPLLVANFPAGPKESLPPNLNMERQILFVSNTNCANLIRR